VRSLILNKNGLNKIRARHKELKASDVDESIKSIPPGEWCYLKPKDSEEKWLAFLNPLIDEKFSCIHILQSIEILSVEDYISRQLKAAFEKRLQFNNYKDGCRLFYGASDGLPGLIVDLFSNALITQINTAGVDKFRNYIKIVLEEMTGKKNYFLDNKKYREKEFLPIFDSELLPDIEVLENTLRYKIRAEVIQKVGFYYDHRENRFQLMSILKRLKKMPEIGVDLFCYTGAWGINALSAGVSHCDFVDQGDFKPEVELALKLNSFADKGAFFRSDVFKFLDDSIAHHKKYDVILCDPPAFAKSHSQKDQALEGYSKLHRKVLRVASSGALIAFSSCTHYVDHVEFQKNILEASYKENKKINLVYVGIQGWDHPITTLGDKSSYIKSYFYILE